MKFGKKKIETPKEKKRTTLKDSISKGGVRTVIEAEGSEFNKYVTEHKEAEAMLRRKFENVEMLAVSENNVVFVCEDLIK